VSYEGIDEFKFYHLKSVGWFYAGRFCSFVWRSGPLNIERRITTAILLQGISFADPGFVLPDLLAS